MTKTYKIKQYSMQLGDALSDHLVLHFVQRVPWKENDGIKVREITIEMTSHLSQYSVIRGRD